MQTITREHQDRAAARRSADPATAVVRTFMFTDIQDSAALVERWGDVEWFEVVSQHNEVIHDRVASHGGSVVKSMGDGFMLTFPDAQDALRCAVDIQRSFTRFAGRDDVVRVRIGMHTGPAIAHCGDFYGRHVILAARLAEKACGTQILASSSVREAGDAA